MDIDINTNLEHRKIVFSSITTLKEYISNRIKKISEFIRQGHSVDQFKDMRYNTIINVLYILSDDDNDTIDKKELLDWINSNYKNIIIWYILRHEEGTHFDHIILDNYKISQILCLITNFERNHKTFYIIKWLFTDLFERYSTLIINSILIIDCSLPSCNVHSIYPFTNYDVIKLFYDISLENSEIIFNKQLIFNNYCLPISHDFNDNIKIINWLYGLGDIDICNEIYYDNKTLCLISIVKKYEILKYFYAIYEQLNILYDYEKDTIVTNTHNQLYLLMHSSLKAERRIKILEKQNKIIPDLLKSIAKLSNRLDKIEHNPFFLL